MRRNYLEFMLRAAGLRCKYHYEGATKVSAGFGIQSYGTVPHDDQGLEDNFHRKRKSQQLKGPGLPQIMGEVLFGIHPVKLALQAKRRQPYRLYIKKNTSTEGVKEIIELCSKAHVKVVVLPKHLLNQLAENRPHQGVCLDVSKPEIDYVSLEEEDIRSYMVTEQNHPSFWLLPYTVKDPMNMGNILRSSYFFGVDCVLIHKHQSSPLTPFVSKASSGVAEIINLKAVGSDQSALKFIERWRSNGGSVIGTACDFNGANTTELEDIVVDKPTLLTIGNEAEGLPGEILQHCDINLYIKPHRSAPDLDSLNAATAAGVILHYLARSREKAGQFPKR